MLRLYPAPVSITFVPSGKFVHRLMIAWRPLSHKHSFLRALTSWIPSCTALRLSTQLASNVFSMQRLGLLCTGSLAHLHCLQPNSSNNSTGFQLNGEYGLNWPLWPSKLCILVAPVSFWPLAISWTCEVSAFI